MILFKKVGRQASPFDRRRLLRRISLCNCQRRITPDGQSVVI